MKTLDIELSELLKDYKDEVEKITEEDFKTVAKETVNDLKATSPNDTGDYAKSWTYKKSKGALSSVSYVVYNRKGGLTHLLENGHDVVPAPKHEGKKKRVEGIPHIKPAEERAKEKLIRMIESDLS